MYRQLNRRIEILLVEDNPGDIQLLKLGLAETKANFNLQIAMDGAAALEFLLEGSLGIKRTRPDLILLDLNLPKRSGLQVLQTIKGDASLSLIPVVVLTSSRSPSDVMFAYTHGANSYLQKPYTLDGVFDLMRTIEHYWLDLALLPGCSYAGREGCG